MELNVVLGQKEESVMLAQKLSMKIAKLRKDLEQKDKILSAMLRKSKLDTAEKQRVVTADVKRLESWVRAEAEKYANVIEKRHHLELEAFSEQMRLKDEKLESFRWQLLSMELESERLQSHVEGLNQDVSQLRQDNMKLEALLLEREEELDSLEDQFATQSKPLSCQKDDILNLSLHDPALTHDSFWPKVKIIKKNPTEKEQETKTTFLYKEEVFPSCNESKNIRLIVQSPEKEFEEERESLDPGLIQKETNDSLVVKSGDKSVSIVHSVGAKTKNNPWRMDLQALGVWYKVKRLKQQLLMLERLKGKEEKERARMGVTKG
ncbi:hypothetical protein V6N12_037696 [Hibiscus sabdariffa]|uniref:Uncharacterized protein n=1 Tax=Hibiscus sabdariffa TaxID=183260 RepID=A0ABR2C2Z6_9ROSI